jgi:hypothetical protein
MNLLDLVPILERHLRQYKRSDDTASIFAGYLADGVQALEYRWDRIYTVTHIAPATYSVIPDITTKDIRTIILMASIIYKMGNFSQAKFTDGDFSYDPQNLWHTNPLTLDITELKERLPSVRLAAGRTSPMRGFNNIYNRENYDWAPCLDLIA